MDPGSRMIGNYKDTGGGMWRRTKDSNKDDVRTVEEGDQAAEEGTQDTIATQIEYKVGDRIEAFHNGVRRWFETSIVEVNKDGAEVKWMSDNGVMAHRVSWGEVRRSQEPQGYVKEGACTNQDARTREEEREQQQRGKSNEDENISAERNRDMWFRLCRHLHGGKCTYGNRCRFSHVTEEYKFKLA